MSYKINDNCMGCTLCAKNCPVKAITGNLKEKHSIDPGRCIECGLCGKLCAKGAVEDAAGKVCERVPKDKWLHPVIDESACSGCSVCVEACPKYCLSLSGPKFHGDIHTFSTLSNPDECIGCGTCETACPISAITMK